MVLLIPHRVRANILVFLPAVEAGEATIYSVLLLKRTS
uniref:Uncharacterized protein n=1 Tax=uncultured Armatimonadetes bacterium TaxID=157466 RepID=A0A6J4JGW5_9BACT|nr:hypothetical protein AVDCRST_MAG63-3267 [uncultured Armatimonadetes bacterium]